MTTTTTATGSRVRSGPFRTGKRLEVSYDRSWIIVASRRDLAWQRIRLGLAAVAIFSAGVAAAPIIWR